MIESVANEIWSELKRYVNTVDRAEAAETVLNILIDNDCTADNIKNAFKGDADIKRALTSYLGNDKSDEDDEDDEDTEEDDTDEDEDDNWEN